jgi:hypothetical protein
VVLLSAAVVAVARWRNHSMQWDPAHMVAALPGERPPIFYADVDALRKAGILDLLAGSKAAEDSDYRQFVEQIGFDYRTDLDAVAGAFLNGESFFTVRGRFQWKQLADYARNQGGECHYAICSLQASSPGRKISFYPLRADVLALAVTSEQSGVEAISPSSVMKFDSLPAEPLWISASSAALAATEALPAGLRALLGSLEKVDRITVAAGAQGQRAQLRLSVLCKTPEEAESVKGDLSAAIDALKETSAPQPIASPPEPDWAGFLRGGVFRRTGLEVTGTWPVEQSFLNALVSGATR